MAREAQGRGSKGSEPQQSSKPAVEDPTRKHPKDHLNGALRAKGLTPTKGNREKITSDQRPNPPKKAQGEKSA